MNKDIILFDLDGTLIDPKEGITKSIQYALNHFGIEESSEEQLFRFIGPPLRAGFKEFYGFDDNMAEEATAKYRERYSVRGVYENMLYAGIPELLQKLKAQGKTLFVATSKPTVFAEKILKHFGLDIYFSFVGGSELSGERSEKFEVINYVFEQTNTTNKTKAIMVGDRKHDIVGARISGIDSIGVLYGYGSHEELSSNNPEFLANSVQELLTILCE